MQGITICQPYAHLICLPESHPEHKRVENRTWYTRYRGPLLIHAGKSHAWLEPDEDDPTLDAYGLKIADIAFGAIVGRCDLVDCCHIDAIKARKYDLKYPWLRQHQHTEGPYCFVLANVVALATPIPFRGAQGFFSVPESVVLQIEQQIAASEIS
jgi:hypothetical protein